MYLSEDMLTALQLIAILYELKAFQKARVGLIMCLSVMNHQPVVIPDFIAQLQFG